MLESHALGLVGVAYNLHSPVLELLHTLQTSGKIYHEVTLLNNGDDHGLRSLRAIFSSIRRHKLARVWSLE